jgi:hypothetical protein
MDPKSTAAGGAAVAEYHEHPVIEPGHTLTSVTEKISNVVLRGRHPIPWYIVFFIAFLLLNG